MSGDSTWFYLQLMKHSARDIEVAEIVVETENILKKTGIIINYGVGI